MIARGDIRWFRFASPDKRRPVLVLGRPDVLPALDQVRYPLKRAASRGRSLCRQRMAYPASASPSLNGSAR